MLQCPVTSDKLLPRTRPHNLFTSHLYKPESNEAKAITLGIFNHHQIQVIKGGVYVYTTYALS